MSNDKPVIAPETTKLSDLSPTDKKIAEIEEKLNKPTTDNSAHTKKGTSPSICGEPQTIDDYLEAMLGIKKP